ncbi:hypothetical protein RR48_06608 [Papilio machaon]|uniref:Uncharacterized protein n=1 Tax=Papilio machaon TaxID=76193 RepID=A0A194RJS3_PAPMA|nr:hypothetical protein RR48_06608 [Papilio machaon]
MRINLHLPHGPEGGGIEILSDILSDRSNPEPQMREAITVLTQITAPWMRGHYDLTQLHFYLNSIVDNITDVCLIKYERIRIIPRLLMLERTKRFDVCSQLAALHLDTSN